ncbi:exodeoxyribonuclease III [bacterium]|nr:exodeoxyribonuclease III [candidate division CSSED10-310 bacterium]
MRILSWNINGIRAIEKKGFLNWLKENSPDILCLQETKAQKDQLPETLQKIDDYHTYYTSAERKGYSGVAILSKHEPDDIHNGLNIPEFDMEGRTQIAVFRDVLLYNVYFPNGKASVERLRYKMDFYTAFLEHIKSSVTGGKKVIFCGDVNTAHKEIDLARPKQNEDTSGFLPIERAWIDTVIASGFIDTFREFVKEGEHYSWWDYKTRARDRNIGWRIDYHFISKNLRPQLKDAFILNNVMGSDHCPVGIKIDI